MSAEVVRRGPDAFLTWGSERARHAMNAVDADALAGVVEVLAADDTVSSLVLGADHRSFCSGWDLGDLAEIAGADGDRLEEFFRHGRGLLRALDSFPGPVLGVVNGTALGFGLSLLARCDVVLAAETAVFGLPEIRRGFAPATVLPELYGVMDSRELRAWALTGDMVPATRALASGLVQEVVAVDQLSRRVSELVDGWAGASQAVHQTKRLLGSFEGMTRLDRRCAGIAAASEHFTNSGGAGLSLSTKDR